MSETFRLPTADGKYWIVRDWGQFAPELVEWKEGNFHTDHWNEPFVPWSKITRWAGPVVFKDGEPVPAEWEAWVHLKPDTPGN